MRVPVERIRSRAPCDRRAGGHPDSEVGGPEHPSSAVPSLGLQRAGARLFEQLPSEQCVHEDTQAAWAEPRQSWPPLRPEEPIFLCGKITGDVVGREGLAQHAGARPSHRLPWALVAVVSVPTPPVSLSPSCPSCSYRLCHVPLVVPPRPAGARSHGGASWPMPWLSWWLRAEEGRPVQCLHPAGWLRGLGGVWLEVGL